MFNEYIYWNMLKYNSASQMQMRKTHIQHQASLLASVNTFFPLENTGLSKKMDGIWNRYNLKSTRRIYTFGVLKCSEKFKVLDLP